MTTRFFASNSVYSRKELAISTKSSTCSAVESGLAVAVLTQCSVPPHLQVLGSEHLLGPLEPMEVALLRSRASQGSSAVDSLYDLLIRTLRVRKVEN